MEEVLSRIKEHWESAYRDNDFTILPWETVEPDKELVKLIEDRKIKLGKILDLGCGSGTNSIFMAKAGAEVFGLDISPSAIGIAKERARAQSLKCNFIVGNAYQLDFQKESFDFVLDRGCFHHIPIEFREKYIKGVHRVLKKSGKYFLQAFSKKNRWEVWNEFSLDDLKNYFEKYFKFLEINEITHTQPNGEKVVLWSILMKKI